MTKADVIARVASQTGLSKVDVRQVVEGFIDAVKFSLSQQDPLEIRGFGTFHVVTRAPRTARNPRSRAAVKIPSRKRPVFKPCKEIKNIFK
jgi:nucleoid DNA-binding protein